MFYAIFVFHGTLFSILSVFYCMNCLSLLFLLCFLLHELVLRKRLSDNTKLFVSPQLLRCLYLHPYLPPLHLCLYLHFVCLYLHSISECGACCCVVVVMKIIEVIHYLSLWITKNVFTLHYIITQIDAREMFVTICPVKTCFFMFVTCGTRQFKKPVVSSFATSLCLCVPVCLCVCFLSSSSFFILKIKKKKILLHTLGASLWIFQNRKINT